MNSGVPVLPFLAALPAFTAIDLLAGFVYGYLSQVNTKLTMTIFAIRGVAHTAFYLLANQIFGTDSLRSHYIYVVTAIIVNMTFLIVMRELNLIGRFFSCLMGMGVLGHLIYRVRYIQDQEKAYPT